MIENVERMLAEHVRYLSVEIGSRASGSPGNHVAAEYIGRAFQRSGLHVEEQRYDCPSWQDRGTTLTIDGTAVQAAANAFSPPCSVCAPTAAAGTVAELEQVTLEGQIGILYGDLTKAPLAAKSWFLKSDRDAYVIRLLEEKRPAALITVQAGVGELIRVIEDAELDIPSATVPSHVGLALLRHPAPTVHLDIESERTPGYASNVVGRKAGRGKTRIVLCAHYDTKFDTPGATDNGGGVAILLTLAHLLGQADHTLGMEYVAFSGEEYLPLGDDEYVRRYKDQFGQIVAAINFDGAGMSLGANSITMIACSQTFQEHVTTLTQEYPGIVWVDPWPQSNHSTFSWRGVPSLAFSSAGGGNLAHLRTDTVEWVSPAKLKQVVSLVTDIVTGLQNRSVEWTREPKT